jgi:hypothetical protein
MQALHEMVNDTEDEVPVHVLVEAATHDERARAKGSDPLPQGCQPAQHLVAMRGRNCSPDRLAPEVECVHPTALVLALGLERVPQIVEIDEPRIDVLSTRPCLLRGELNPAEPATISDRYVARM